MKIRSPKEPLLAAVQTAAAVVPARSPKPVLTNVKLEAETSRVVSATDLEIGHPGRGRRGGDLAPGRAAAEWPAGGDPPGESAGTVFEIESDGTAAVVKAARSQFRLPVEDPLEFPSVAAFPEEACFELSTPLVRELVRRTVFATDNESSRYALGGVLMELTGSGVIAVGTDGRRLAKMEGPAARSRGASRPTPSRSCRPGRCSWSSEAWAPPRRRCTWPCRCQRDSGADRPTTISARLVEGRFPRWRDVFPERPDAIRVQLVAGPLLAAVRQAAIVTSEQSKGVDFSFEPGQLVLSGRSAESGESRVELPIDHAGETVRIKLDPRFVSDFLRVLDGGTTITVELTDRQSACVCRTEDGYGYVIMPLAAD